MKHYPFSQKSESVHQFVKKQVAKSDRAAYHLALIYFYSNLPELINDLEIATIIERPSFDSYRKWRQKNIGTVAHLINTRGNSDDQQNRRPKLGTSSDMVPAPYKLWLTDIKNIRCCITTPLAPGFVIKSIS